MPTIKTQYGNSNQAVTLTLAGLANSGARSSTYRDNASDLFIDALVSLQVKTGWTGVAATGYLNVYAYATTDGGTTYTDGATGSDAGITLPSMPNARLVGIITAGANNTTYKSGPFSVAAAFGGVLPERWGIIVENKTGAALSAP